MTGKDLFREVGNISEKYITEAEETKKSIIHNVAFRRGLGTAACLVLCVGIFAITRMVDLGSKEAASDSAPHYNQASDGTNHVHMSTAEQEVVGDSANSSIWEESIDSIKEQDRAESSVEVESYAPSNTPEEVVGEEPEMSDSAMIKFDEDLVIERLQAYSNDYEELLQAEAFVVAHGKVKNGLNAWEGFLEKVQSGKSARVDLIEFTVEGDAIITAIVYDGELYHVVMDCTRDAWGKTGIVKYEYKYLYMDTQEERTEVVLSDLELKDEEIRDAIMSDGLDIHYLVQYMNE